MRHVMPYLDSDFILALMVMSLCLAIILDWVDVFCFFRPILFVYLALKILDL